MSHTAPEGAALHGRLFSDPLTVSAALGPIPLDLALAALGRQPALMAPAKLAIPACQRPLLIAEVPRTHDVRQCETQARAALDTALAWLRGGADAGDGANPALGPRLEDALETLGWRWEPLERDSYLVRADAAGTATRLVIQGGACVRVSRAPLAVRVSGPAAARALPLFALEANARLRLARVSIAVAQTDPVRVEWDAVLLPERPLDRGLQDAADALDVAHAETARALRALATSAVAETYLESRTGAARLLAVPAAPRADGSTRQPPASPPAITEEERACTQP